MQHVRRLMHRRVLLALAVILIAAGGAAAQWNGFPGNGNPPFTPPGVNPGGMTVPATPGLGPPASIPTNPSATLSWNGSFVPGFWGNGSANQQLNGAYDVTVMVNGVAKRAFFVFRSDRTMIETDSPLVDPNMANMTFSNGHGVWRRTGPDTFDFKYSKEAYDSLAMPSGKTITEGDITVTNGSLSGTLTVTTFDASGNSLGSSMPLMWSGAEIAPSPSAIGGSHWGLHLYRGTWRVSVDLGGPIPVDSFIVLGSDRLLMQSENPLVDPAFGNMVFTSGHGSWGRKTGGGIAFAFEKIIYDMNGVETGRSRVEGEASRSMGKLVGDIVITNMDLSGNVLSSTPSLPMTAERIAAPANSSRSFTGHLLRGSWEVDVMGLKSARMTFNGDNTMLESDALIICPTLGNIAFSNGHGVWGRDTASGFSWMSANFNFAFEKLAYDSNSAPLGTVRAEGAVMWSSGVLMGSLVYTMFDPAGNILMTMPATTFTGNRVSF